MPCYWFPSWLSRHQKKPCRFLLSADKNLLTLSEKNKCCIVYKGLSFHVEIVGTIYGTSAAKNALYDIFSYLMPSNSILSPSGE